MSQETVTDSLQNFSAKNFEGTAGRILELLGNGLSPEVTASAVGVSPSYISQLLSQQEFAEQVTARRFVSLQEATSRDKKYDALEDALIEKMQDLLPLMYKPHDVLRAISVINAAKRRGSSAPDNMVINNTVVSLSLPTTILNNFRITTDTNNQVIEAGEQALVTMPSNALSSLSDKLRGKDTENECPSSPSASQAATTISAATARARDKLAALKATRFGQAASS